MTDRTFFVITGTEDGDAYLRKLNEEEVLKFIDEEKDFTKPRKYISGIAGLHNIGEQNGTLIIEGKIVMPKAVEVVKKWEI